MLFALALLVLKIRKRYVVLGATTTEVKLALAAPGFVHATCTSEAQVPE